MAQAPATQAIPLQVTITGLVQQVTQRESAAGGTTFLMLVKTPAPDQFSSPGTFEIRSRKRLGQKGSMIEVLCDLIGYARSYERKSDGETVRTAEAVLQAAAE